MKKKGARRMRKTYQEEAIAWLPVDSRLFPFISFSHVRGIARVFLIIEMVLSVTMVIGSLCIVSLKFLLK
ncbi:hypothetical protein A2Z00_01055 [Candidatus Gottesmanbacteria bacterium RBG_13_45_10]|uniref:Uncharacterized protein n=1 Tax=Candidatus Gottesmanbacteria bacterium RBG_13_45_10 TaxID=1798370 RepID=A0A1F5ZHP1_9BACT|nr:MAG: hypothetical protein A2Z00_01055 [Candidatus Gottesmanbacteria bacterium RBG_13_45_10]